MRTEKLASRRRHILSLSKVEYMDYNCNYCEGCQHGCVYCWSRRVKRITYRDWINPCLVPNTLELLERDIELLKPSGEIYVCESTDPYQPVARGLTRKVIRMLMDYNLNFSILTKSAAVKNDLNLLRDYSKCRLGFTIVTLTDSVRRSVEPFASPIQAREEILKLAHDMGIRTWVSVEPILPSLVLTDPLLIISTLMDYVDWFVFGRLNYLKGVRYNGVFWRATNEYYAKLMKKIIDFCDAHGIKYHVKV